MRYAAPKGTHDILPPGNDRTDWADDIGKWHWLEGVFRDVCRRYGYEEIRTPIFEAAELFKRAVGDGTDIVHKEMYQFDGRPDKDGNVDHFALRPEGTAPTLRAYVENRVWIERPVAKMYYIAPIFRYEREQRGRYRQHYQVGIEALGSEGPDIDAEAISLAMAFFGALGVGRLTLKLNSVGTTESRARYVAALREFAEPLLPQMSEDNQRRFRENALRMLDSKAPTDIALMADAPFLSDYLDDESRAHFDKLRGYLDAFGVAYEIDPRLVRGLDYYTRTAFEIQSPDVGAQSTLCGGGRYDRLVENLGGPPTPGIGFGLGVERALIALQAAQVPVPALPGPAAFLCPLGSPARDAAVPLLATLRASNLSADMDYTGRKLKVMLEQADRLNARYALILGDSELSEGVVQLRDMKTKEQKAVPLAELAEVLGIGKIP